MSSSPLAVLPLAQAQNLFVTAIICERSKRWRKVVENYKELLGLLSTKNFSENILHDPYFRLLMYEIYYHLGVAFQNLNQHGKAVLQFTSAEEKAFAHKHGCTARCISRTCFHTPVLARRAYAYVKYGQMKKAMEDAEMAVILDSLNPDVYCIRALVWSTMQNKKNAVVDLGNSLRLNPSHAGALILRGTLRKSLMGGNGSSDVRIQDHEKVLKVHHGTYDFLDVEDFNSPKIEQFYNRFLWSLNIPHTIVNLNWLMGSESILKPPGLSTTACSISAMHRNCEKAAPRQSVKKEPFRCGTLTTYPDRTAMERRLHYSATMKDNGISDTALKLTREAPAWSDQRAVSKTVCGRLTTRQTVTVKKERMSDSMHQQQHTGLKNSLLKARNDCVSEAGYLKDAIKIYNKPWRRNILPPAKIMKKCPQNI